MWTIWGMEKETTGSPEPEQARNGAEFVALMRELKRVAGLTYRQLEQRAADRGEVLARSTIASVLGGTALPRPELLAAFVHACGEGRRVAVWLAARDAVAARQAAGAAREEEPPAARRSVFSGRPGRLSALLVTAAAAVIVAAAAAWMSPASDAPAEPDRSGTAGRSPQPSGAWAPPPSGWVLIRPVTEPRLCLTDGRVQDRRYTPLVAVQRPCGSVAPQNTMLEPMGGDTYRIQWHHPDYGKGCLKALTDGPGAGLLEPMDACQDASRFHIEPSGADGSGWYVLRVAGQGCVGIKGSGTSEGTEAVMERCVGKGGQVFLINSAA
ncbi:hypothetical protein GCM10010232_15450 [Streptomyces amakusaensis]